jgi:hypothetical protein
MLCLQDSAQQHRREFESYLLHHLSGIPSFIDQPHKPAPAACFRLLHLSTAAASPTPLDLVRCIVQPQLLQQFNPFLAPAAAQQLREGVLLWMQLCVLEDRLGRLLQLEAAGPEYTPLLIRVSQQSHCI